MEDKGKQLYLNFDEYVRQGEPEAAESAKQWSAAIGLQDVDGLKPSPYLIATAKRNIEGEITIDQVQELLQSYYATEANRAETGEGAEEADKAAANIKRILSTRTLSFSAIGFAAMHRRIFEGVMKHAGELRKYDITKKEWVLRGDTVRYLNWEDLQRALEYEIQQEKDFSYKGLMDVEKVKHLCRFASGLWQIHPFCEGNTRTTAVFLIQYLRSIGYDVDNDMFARHSWYFRNALVRANYKNLKLDIDYDYSYLERFFYNLLLGEQNELKNRHLLIVT
ncbi:MAG: Fic family protein [Muribaculaceae bacterium]|mgnify:CR=1 FL=1|nr:Fic family protein [Muribaculaceae bacterium]